MLINNKMIGVILKLTDQQCKFEILPLDTAMPTNSNFLKETTYVKFSYPSIFILKGCTEILVYSVTENLYYYMNLPAPVLKMCSTVMSSSDINVKVFYDHGEYLIYSNWYFTFGSSPYIYQTLYKRYLEKSSFPKSKLLKIFEIVKCKFISKEEDAFVLQFADSIMCLGSCTYNLIQITDSDYEAGEVIHGTYEGFYLWKKGGKAITYKPTPVNFADR